MKIISGRVLQGNINMMALVTSRAPMSYSSSSSTPATTSKKSSDVSTNQQETGVRKRESIRSMLASIIGGYVDPANPNDPKIPATKVDFPDIVEHATGEQKLFLLAFENGILDPYCNLPIERNGRGSKDNPVQVPSFINERLVGCICEDSQNYIKYTTIYKDEPKRCQCGHWIELVEAPRFWEKIPKEDLVTIPYFRELEEEGKLDKLLSGELDKEEEHKHHHH